MTQPVESDSLKKEEPAMPDPILDAEEFIEAIEMAVCAYTRDTKDSTLKASAWFFRFADYLRQHAIALDLQERGRPSK